MLAQRLRRWTNLQPTLGERVVRADPEWDQILDTNSKKAAPLNCFDQ